MSKELDNVFVDVRNAFRLLNDYQKHILNIVNYIREQTEYAEMWGRKNWYSNEIGNKKNSPDSDYAKLNIRNDMWGWDFLYGYILEYYFGDLDKKRKGNIEMSVIQVSDDGYFVSNRENKSMTKISTFEDSENSHSYIILNMALTKKDNLWLSDLDYPDDDMKDFLTKFISSSEDKKIMKNDKGDVSVIKKYEMQRFATQKGADAVIQDFGKIVFEQTSIRLFKDSFYDNEV